MLKSYLKNTAGNMAMTFAVSAMFVLAGIGAAIDFNAMSSDRSTYQSYADAAVLAVARSDEENIDALIQIAQDTVDGNNFSEQILTTNLTILPDGTYHVEVSATHNLMLMGMFGKKTHRISVAAEVPPPAASQKLNIALVLDVTDSMEGTKIATLKTAATTLVDDISGGADGETMFSVVPFARFVELPLSVASESWINVEPDGNDCWTALDEDNSVNCRQVGSGEDAYTECDVTVTKEVCEFRTWDGCVGSRAAPWHERDYYGGTKIEAFTMNDWCHSTMLPLTTSVSDTKFTINDMSTAQSTYIPAGLIWGWRALMPAAPFTQANTVDYNERKKVLLLMSDGENSQSLGGTSSTYEGIFHWEEDVAAADLLTAELCMSIKADGVEIYTIAFEVTDAATISLLRNCATDTGKFYDASNASQLKSAFSDIGTGIEKQIRLSK